jgi:putative endonuclease
MTVGDPTEGTVYLLHFNQPIGNPDNPRAQAQHYVGWTSDLAERVASHTAHTRPQPGNGTIARIVAHVQANGVGFVVAQTWPGGRWLERRIKNRKNAPRLCPICRAA